MSQIQRVAQSRKLFKHYIERNIQRDKDIPLYFYRMSRYRFNSYNFTKCIIISIFSYEMGTTQVPIIGRFGSLSCG